MSHRIAPPYLYTYKSWTGCCYGFLKKKIRRK